MLFRNALRCFPALRNEFECSHRGGDSNSPDFTVVNWQYVDSAINSEWVRFYSNRAIAAAVSAKDTDEGPWRYRHNAKAVDPIHRYFIESDASLHDVRLYVNGDFADDEQRQEYGCGIAAILNGVAAQSGWENRDKCLVGGARSVKPDAVSYYLKNSRDVLTSLGSAQTCMVEEYAKDTARDLLNLWWLKSIDDAEYFARMLAVVEKENPHQ